MDHDSFKCFLLESFAPHFFSHEAYDSSISSLRYWITEKEAFIHEEDLMKSPILTRTFSFFDKAKKGLLSLPELLSGIEKISVGSFSSVARYLFFLTDIQDRKSIGEDEVLYFFEAFSQFYTSFALQVLKLERPRLKEAGVGDGVLESYSMGLLSVLESIEVDTEDEVSDLVNIMRGKKDGRISYREYLGNRGCLPRMYRRFLAMLDSLVYFKERSGPSFINGSTTGETPGLSPEGDTCSRHLPGHEAGRITDMFNAYSDTGTWQGKMGQDEFSLFLLEGCKELAAQSSTLTLFCIQGFASSFFSSEAHAFSSSHVLTPTLTLTLTLTLLGGSRILFISCSRMDPEWSSSREY